MVLPKSHARVYSRCPDPSEAGACFAKVSSKYTNASKGMGWSAKLDLVPSSRRCDSSPLYVCFVC